MPIFTKWEAVETLRQACRYVLYKHAFRIDVAVILPDRLHMLGTLPANDSDYPTRWRLIKSYSPVIGASRQACPFPNRGGPKVKGRSGKDDTGNLKYGMRIILTGI